jgi:hypothetical protein
LHAIFLADANRLHRASAWLIECGREVNVVAKTLREVAISVTKRNLLAANGVESQENNAGISGLFK